jgi:hypothetical protein
MKPKNATQPPVSQGKRRFRVQKLEERVAPRGNKNGWDNPKNPHYTGNCTSFSY